MELDNLTAALLEDLSIDLSATETANCYVAGKAVQEYRFKATVMGNGTITPAVEGDDTKKGITPSPLAPASASILWQSERSLISGVKLKNDYIYFTLNGSEETALKAGNAVIAAYAMKAGKHVFVEKPMAKTIYETRFLRDLAKQTGVVTQMGNQGHNIEGTMQTVEWIQGGVIGDVKEVHLWTNRPMWRLGYFDRPAGVDIPSNLNYDVWLGPAPDKPYNPEMLHFAWRGLWDYGTGAMGDMGAHTFDAPIWALNLGMPTKIQATSTPYNKDYLPQSECVTYEFPARGNMPPVKVTWSDGGIKPARPAELEPNRQLREALYIGDKGLIMHGTHGAEPQLIPERPGFVAPEKTLKRPSNIYVDFIEAIKEGRKAANDFEVSAKLTEIMLLTNIAVAAQRLDLTLEYDAENMRITNCPEANDYFHYEYRKGWSL